PERDRPRDDDASQRAAPGCIGWSRSLGLFVWRRCLSNPWERRAAVGDLVGRGRRTLRHPPGHRPSLRRFRHYARDATANPPQPASRPALRRSSPAASAARPGASPSTARASGARMAARRDRSRSSLPAPRSPGPFLYDGANIWVTDNTAGRLLKLDARGAVLQTVTVRTSPHLPVLHGADIRIPP